ncbi:MAG: hypothetical protein NTW35_01335 [Candidatus Nomurabacteria bacterium]|nr:hypothetical protein [Candidatus Nomurabacteria bacterium]
MVIKKKTHQDIETARKAFLICLAKPFNNIAYSYSVEIETMIDLLQQAKTDKEFKRTLDPLIKFCEQQLVAVNNLTEVVKAMGEDPPQPEKPKVH